MLAFVTPLIPLEPGTAYTLGLAGVTDTNGGSLPETAVAFTTAGGKNSAETGKNSPSQAPASAGAAPVAADHFPPLKAPPGVTALSGRAATLDSRGLQNVTLRIDPIVASIVMLPAFYALGAIVYQVYYVSFERRGQEALRRRRPERPIPPSPWASQTLVAATL